MAGEPPTVDLRVLQANERTLLAWIRTGLAVMAFGFVIARIGLWMRATDPAEAEGSWSVWLGAAVVVLGTLTELFATVRYLAVRRAILEGRAIVPGNAAALMLAFGLVIVGGILFAHLLVG